MNRRSFVSRLTCAIAVSPFVASRGAACEPQEEARSISVTCGAGKLATLVDSMAPGTWAELTDVAGIDAALAVGTSVACRFSYANSAGRDGARGRIAFVGGDHYAADNTPAARALALFNDATNSWSATPTRNPANPSKGLGSHVYQHTVVDPVTGDLWLFAIVGERSATYPRGNSIMHIYRSVGGTEPFEIAANDPEGLGQTSSSALAWWRGPFAGSAGKGVLVLHAGYFSTLHVFDPFAHGGGKWILSKKFCIPGQAGKPHAVSAYSGLHNCLVFGGGYRQTQMARLDADGSITQIPPAPRPIGIFSGCNFVGNGGLMLALGFGELWRLDPSGVGAWTKLAAPTVPVMDPATGASIMSCDCYDLGCTVYWDHAWNLVRTPKTRMWVYKPGGSAPPGVNRA